MSDETTEQVRARILSDMTTAACNARNTWTEAAGDIDAYVAAFILNMLECGGAKVVCPHGEELARLTSELQAANERAERAEAKLTVVCTDCKGDPAAACVSCFGRPRAKVDPQELIDRIHGLYADLDAARGELADANRATLGWTDTIAEARAAGRRALAEELLRVLGPEVKP